MGVVAGKMSIRAVAGKLLALQLRAMPEPEEYRVVGQHGSSGVQHRPVPVEVGELPPPSTQGPNHRCRQPLQQPPAVLTPEPSSPVCRSTERGGAFSSAVLIFFSSARMRWGRAVTG